MGGAVDADTGERLTALRVFGAKELVGEYWLTEEETVELAVRLLAMEQWHRPEVAEPCGAGSGERE